MKRIELILMKLKEKTSTDAKGFSATEIAEELNLTRGNVSTDLNKLVSEGKVKKIKGKPTLFIFIDKEIDKSEASIINRFSEFNPSLYTAIEQAKAAILYPPNGMNMLLLGETGVGKSTFAGLIYKYAVEMKIRPKDSPFITFNCADYANNPQLLLGQLFGVKKGAYTGADSDKQGLLEKADGGILFLDEVHRLPAEGQEMFFTFMDRGVYRRLGETDSERSAKVLIITATTEDPNMNLLQTFTRRIPMVITIPPLRNRGMEERFNLIKQFMIEESGRLGKSINVSVNSLKAFLSYDCPNNIGQLKSDIQLTCAKAYADFLSNRKEDIRISSLELQPYIREGLYKEVEHRQLWNKLIDINNRYCVFDKNEKQMIFEENEQNQNIYEMLDAKTRELKAKGIEGKDFEEEMESDIEEYFKNYMIKFHNKADTVNFENIIEPYIMSVIKKVVNFCETELKRELDKQIYYGLAVHISNSIDRIKRNKKIENPKLNKIRKEYSKEFNIALEALKIIEEAIDREVPIDEAGFLTMFLIYNSERIKNKRDNVNVIIIAHGEGTATCMANAVNGLLGTQYAKGINAPIEEKPQVILERTKDYIRENKITSDVLFLVDMGSLVTFGKEIEVEFKIKTRTIPLVSTLHCIEATRKAIIGYTLDEIYRDTLEVNNLYDNNVLDYIPQSPEERKLAIITVCTTGEGSAKAMKVLLERNLKFENDFLEIVPVNFIGKESIYSRLDKLSNKYEIICLVSPFELESDYIQYNLEDIIEGNCIENIQDLINREKVYVKMEETLEHQLKNIEGKAVLSDIKRFTTTVTKLLNIKLTSNAIIGITLHMAVMVDRLCSDEVIDAYNNIDSCIKENSELYRIMKTECSRLNTKYTIYISDDEICYLMNLFTMKSRKNKAH
ncbi:transcriptional regulatory protein LevR/transcriptional regulator with AAA-type ATPase domain [Clostridium beijerinckii]|uniref:sigma 54-interacting transcriptional regulator n=1 Tax=Clostridium beijerinckii TaxID=1520 RepID=UPI00156D5D7D|nr:sigma-54-dependent transcriptional regulator [Clostridium beijerinckii]NRT33043.1 transcriptional regulatory protein LevR/transcriptional regulator with AAA-type ATPase domain [Clostridium beijerinckii]NRT47532.1 transcriptional regulatory protein LevR/transcriptional regulator with AAA-type ATPase domain [Clostridium beijerinckii]NRZ24178.1 transcriptional regulatory protein LevR/transcriptional regulator with AAA-type ATPase domain [Clostridium beijerinckii]